MSIFLAKKKPVTRPKKNPIPKYHIPGWMFFLLIISSLYFSFEKFSDFVDRQSDGTYVLKNSRKQELNNRIRRIREEAHQYVLKVGKNGFYECLHCPNGVFYLYKGEVWKYGVTIQGEQKRYNPKYMRRMGFYYEVQFQGKLQQALEQETIKIGQYPLLPENLLRPDEPQGELIRYKLARPPGQTGDF